MSQSHIERLIVLGATHRVGQEVARMGVAYGIEVIGIARTVPPEHDEPWTHGVNWIAADLSTPGALASMPDASTVICASGEAPADDLSRFGRVVWVGDSPPVGAADATNEWIVAVPGDVDDSPIDWDSWEPSGDAIRVEALGMALLRAALEDEVAPLLEHDALLYLGDAVMLQESRG
jgi:hypothetical protein